MPIRLLDIDGKAEIKTLSTLVSNTKSQITDATTGSDVRLTVTGVDAKGQMFRHSATVLMLDGRQCAFMSKSQPELESSILAEFDYPQAHPKNRVSQARVRSSQVYLESGLHKVTVELEIAQTAKVTADQIESPNALKKPAVSPLPVGKAESKGSPIIELREPASLPQSTGGPQTISRASRESGPAIVSDNRGLFPKAQAEDPGVVQAALKAAVASEINQQINLLKNWVTAELEKAVPAMVTSKLEKLVGQAVEKQVAANSQTTLQALNTNVAREVGERIVESQELRTTLEAVAKKLFEEQTKFAKAVGADVEQELNARAGAIIQSLEGSIAKMETRIIAAPAKAEQELNARAATIIQSFEDSISKMETQINTAPAKVDQELNSRTATFIRSFEDSVAEMESRINAAPAKVEQELNSRAAAIVQTFEDSIAEMETKINAAPAKVELVLNVRAAAIIQSFENSVAEMETKISAAPARVEEELISRASMISRSFEDSLAEMETRMSVAPAKIEHQLSLRTASILQSFEHSIAEKELRINEAQSEMAAALIRVQTLRQEAIDGMLPIQKAVEQLNNIERTGMENIQKQAAAQLIASAAQFQTQLHKISAERAVQFVVEMEEQIAPHRENADETVEKIGAVLQLIQGTARVQQERLAEYSKTTAANFEKEIRALLLRLAGGA